MKKRILISLLALALAFSVAGCSGKNEKKNDTESKETTRALQTTDAPDTEEPDPQSPTDSEAADTSKEDTLPEHKGNPLPVSESCDALLHSTAGFEVRAVSYKSEKGAHILKFKAENMTGANYNLSFSRVLVNGVYVDAAAELYCPSGTPAEKELVITSAMLEDPGIDIVSEIELTLKVSLTDSREALTTKELRLVTPSYNANIVIKKDGTSVINNNMVKLTVTNTKKDTAGGVKLTLCFENSTQNDLNFAITKLSAEGNELEASYSRAVPAGTTAFGSFSISAKTLESKGLSADKLEELVLSAAASGVTGVPFSCEDVTVPLK